MKLIELSELLQNESKAEQYLLKVGILKSFTHCGNCGSAKLGRIRREKYKCYSCKSEWSIRKGSMLYSHQIRFTKFLGVLKCFEIELDAKKTALEFELDKSGVQRIFNLIREAIADNISPDNQRLIFEKKSLSFSIKTTNEKVEICFNNNLDVAELFSMKRYPTLNKEIIYKFSCEDIKSKVIKRNINNFPTVQKNFWNYANTKLQKFRGTCLKYLYLYLKEIEFRYNNPLDLFNKMIEKIVNFKGWS
ncbi:MAG: hypothetical protein WAR79_17510 [Melioribacteraceae bacterium]